MFLPSPEARVVDVVLVVVVMIDGVAIRFVAPANIGFQDNTSRASCVSKITRTYSARTRKAHLREL